MVSRKTGMVFLSGDDSATGNEGREWYSLVSDGGSGTGWPCPGIYTRDGFSRPSSVSSGRWLRNPGHTGFLRKPTGFYTFFIGFTLENVCQSWERRSGGCLSRGARFEGRGYSFRHPSDLASCMERKLRWYNSPNADMMGRSRGVRIF